MNVAAIVLTVDLPGPEVFDLLANPANLPQWLVAGAAPEAHPVDWKIEADSRTGVIDVWIYEAGAAAGSREVLPVRLLAASVTRCLVLLTRVAPTELREADHSSGLEQLGERLEAFLASADQSLGCGWM